MTSGHGKARHVAATTTTTGMTALVLGGSGFIGGHLIRALLAKPEFTRIQMAGSRVSAAEDHPRINAIAGAVDSDLFRRCAEPDVVFWAIGGSSVGASVQNPELDFSRSIPPLSDLLARFSSTWRQSRLVFLSSAAVYGAAGSQATATSSPLLPISPYGLHKRLSEEMIQERFDSDLERCTIVRPFSVYGSGLRRQLFWDALAKAQRNDLLFNGTGEELRDWLYIGDLVDLLADIGASPALFPSVLNAGTGKGISVSSALHELYSFLPDVPVPRFAGSPREGDPDRLVASAEQQQALAGYFRTTLREGLDHYHAWHRTLAS